MLSPHDGGNDLSFGAQSHIESSELDEIRDCIHVVALMRVCARSFAQTEFYSWFKRYTNLALTRLMPSLNFKLIE